MYIKKRFPHFETDDAHAVGLPYKGNAELVLVVPKERFGVDAVLKNLDLNQLRYLLQKDRPYHEVVVSYSCANNSPVS